MTVSVSTFLIAMCTTFTCTPVPNTDITIVEVPYNGTEQDFTVPEHVHQYDGTKYIVLPPARGS